MASYLIDFGKLLGFCSNCGAMIQIEKGLFEPHLCTKCKGEKDANINKTEVRR